MFEPKIISNKIDHSKSNLQNKDFQELFTFIKGNYSVVEIDISSNNMQGFNFSNISALNGRTIEKLNLSKSNLGLQGIKDLAEFLKGATIVEINLSYNKIGPEIKEHLQTILNNNNIKKIDLSHNNICDSGAAYVVNGLRNNKVTTEINFSHNSIGVEGVYISEILQFDTETSNSAIETIILKNNEIDYSTAKALIKSFNNNPTWTHLDLRDNRIDSRFFTELRDELLNHEDHTLLLGDEMQ